MFYKTLITTLNKIIKWQEGDIEPEGPAPVCEPARFGDCCCDCDCYGGKTKSNHAS